MQLASTKVQNVRFKLPVLQRETIGSKPTHFFDQNPQAKESYVPLSDRHKGGEQIVWASQPVRLADGSVKFDEVSREVDLRPRSPLIRGLAWGAIGTVPGGLLGLAVSPLLGIDPGLGFLGGALAVGGLAGGIGAYSLVGEKTTLVWDSHEVYQHRMEGYHEKVGLGEKEGERGYFHRFLPEVKSEVVDSFQTPRVLRYKGDRPPNEILPQTWPSVSLQKESEVPNRVLDVTVSHEKAMLKSRPLGSMPSDYWSYSSSGTGETSCGPEGCEVAGGQQVFRQMPVYEPNDEARVDAVTQRITEKASSVTGYAVGFGALGGTVGAFAGLLVAGITGLSPAIPAAVGAGLGAAGGAFWGARSAADDRVRLEWRERPILEGKMVGYRESVSTHYETKCESHYDSSEKEFKRVCREVANGYDHDFYPNIENWSVGSVVVPHVVHYSATKEGESKAPKAASS